MHKGKDGLRGEGSRVKSQQDPRVKRRKQGAPAFAANLLLPLLVHWPFRHATGGPGTESHGAASSAYVRRGLRRAK
jgi:hypothetical protein